VVRRYDLSTHVRDQLDIDWNCSAKHDLQSTPTSVNIAIRRPQYSRAPSACKHTRLLRDRLCLHADGSGAVFVYVLTEIVSIYRP